MTAYDQYRMRVQIMHEAIVQQCDGLQQMLANSRNNLCLAAAWMIIHDEAGALYARDQVWTQHIQLGEFSPYGNPRFCGAYLEWVRRALAIAKFPGWEKRGLRSAYEICTAALALQDTALWYICSASRARDVDDLLARPEGRWLCRLFMVSKPSPEMNLPIEMDDSPF